MVDAFYYISEIHIQKLVASTGIEPVSGASETLILSIVLRGLAESVVCGSESGIKNSRLKTHNPGLLYQSRCISGKHLDGNSQQNYAKKLSYS